MLQVFHTLDLLVCDISATLHMHGFMETFCLIHQIWWPCGEGEEMRQLSELLYKKGCPIGKAPTGKPGNEPFVVFPSCFTSVHWQKPKWHIHAHYLRRRRDKYVCSFSNQAIFSFLSDIFILLLRGSQTPLEAAKTKSSIHLPLTDQCLFIDTRSWGKYKVFPFSGLQRSWYKW